MANLHMVNVSALDFHAYGNTLKDNRNETQLQHLTTIPLIQVNKIFQHIINSTQHIMPSWYNWWVNRRYRFDLDTMFSHTGMYVTAIGLLIPEGLGMFCCYFFWCQPARLACQPLQPGNTQYTIVDDDVEVAPIYRCDGKALPPDKTSWKSYPGYRTFTYMSWRVDVRNSQSH